MKEAVEKAHETMSALFEQAVGSPLLPLGGDAMVDEEQFWARVDRTDDCWIWSGGKTAGGYGNLRLPGGRNGYAHRVAYELTVGSIPPGMVLDHLCRNRACVNPGHLDPVTHAENCRRGASAYGAIRPTCKHGHDITDLANVYADPSGANRCRVCASVENDRRRLARQARAATSKQEMDQ